ncbi:MAG: hypothetical protein ACYCU3_16260, partial [Streptosporangiaceae bacterium]
TIFARAITESDAYDGQVRDLKLRRVPVDQALRELTASDVRRAGPAHAGTPAGPGRSGELGVYPFTRLDRLCGEQSSKGACDA